MDERPMDESLRVAMEQENKTVMEKLFKESIHSEPREKLLPEPIIDSKDEAKKLFIQHQQESQKYKKSGDTENFAKALFASGCVLRKFKTEQAAERFFLAGEAFLELRKHSRRNLSSEDRTFFSMAYRAFELAGTNFKGIDLNPKADKKKKEAAAAEEALWRAEQKLRERAVEEVHRQEERKLRELIKTELREEMKAEQEKLKEFQKGDKSKISDSKEGKRARTAKEEKELQDALRKAEERALEEAVIERLKLEEAPRMKAKMDAKKRAGTTKAEIAAFEEKVLDQIEQEIKRLRQFKDDIEKSERAKVNRARFEKSTDCCKTMADISTMLSNYNDAGLLYYTAYIEYSDFSHSRRAALCSRKAAACFNKAGGQEQSKNDYAKAGLLYRAAAVAYQKGNNSRASAACSEKADECLEKVKSSKKEPEQKRKGNNLDRWGLKFN